MPLKNLENVFVLLFSGDDKEEFLKQYKEPTGTRPHFNPYLCIVIKNNQGDLVASASTWYDIRTDYAYLEPVCVIPIYRKLGLGKAAVYAAINHARELGARRVIVNSGQEFYERIGFKKKNHSQDPAHKKRRLRAEIELTSKNDEQSGYNDVKKNEEEED